MHDMIGLAMLVELSRKDGRRKHEFEHLLEKPPFRSRLYHLLRKMRGGKTTKGPD